MAPQAYNLVFYANYSDWDDGGWLVIAEKDGKYYYQSGCCDEPFCLEPIDRDEALDIMLEWAEHEDTDIHTVEECFHNY